jgi:GNAT superfamily N-acetyltransferase
MPDGVIIRPAEDRDIKRIRALQAQDVMAADGQVWSHKHLNMVMRRGFLFAAEHDGAVVGYICGERLLDNGAMLWYHIVDEEFRGQGIGTLLLDYFEQVLQEQGVEWFIAYSDKSRVVNFHKKRGASIGDSYTEIIKDF